MKINKLLLTALSAAMLLQSGACFAGVIKDEDKVWNHPAYWSNVRTLTEGGAKLASARAAKNSELLPLDKSVKEFQEALHKIESSYKNNIQVLENKLSALTEQRVSKANEMKNKALAELSASHDKERAADKNLVELEAKLNAARSELKPKLDAYDKGIAESNQDRRKAGIWWDEFSSFDAGLRVGALKKAVEEFSQTLGIPALKESIEAQMKPYNEKAAKQREAIEVQFQKESATLSQEEQALQQQINQLIAESAKAKEPNDRQLKQAEEAQAKIISKYSIGTLSEVIRDHVRQKVTNEFIAAGMLNPPAN